MKTTHEMATVDRISTHEELHQVLALLNDSAARVTDATEPQEENDLQEAVANLWRESENAGEGELELESDPYRWAELAVKADRVN
jgi:hypothetical protein